MILPGMAHAKCCANATQNIYHILDVFLCNVYVTFLHLTRYRGVITCAIDVPVIPTGDRFSSTFHSDFDPLKLSHRYTANEKY